MDSLVIPKYLPWRLGVPRDRPTYVETADWHDANRSAGGPTRRRWPRVLAAAARCRRISTGCGGDLDPSGSGLLRGSATRKRGVRIERVRGPRRHRGWI